ncbi:homocysteine S-methyltransferase family protein [Marinomonas transparens]|nr:homocysteine S-methyltransferase family protein [Marinomonas transparens]
MRRNLTPSFGANIIGGCGGIKPSHIKALAEWKNSLKKRSLKSSISQLRG